MVMKTIGNYKDAEALVAQVVFKIVIQFFLFLVLLNLIRFMKDI